MKSFSYTYCRSFAIEGNFGFVGDSSGLYVIDLTDKANPIEIGKIASINSARDIDIEGNHLYVADYSGGLKCVDISDPYNPVLIDTEDNGWDAWAVEIWGNVACVSTDHTGFVCVDISDPYNMVEIGSVSTPGQGFDVDVTGNVAFMASDLAGLLCIDISEPTNPKLIGSKITAGRAWGIDVVGNIAYIADESEGLVVCNVSDPYNPTVMGNLTTTSNIYKVKVHGNMLYTAESTVGVRKVNITDPSNPSSITAINTGGTVRDLEVTPDGWIYTVENSDGLKYFRVGDVIDPIYVGTYYFGPTRIPLDLAIDGTLLHAATDTAVYVVNVSDAGNMVYVNSYGSDVSRLDVDGGVSIIGTDSSGLQSWNISDINSPSLKDQMSFSFAKDIKIAGNLSYVLGDSGLFSISIGNLSNIYETGTGSLSPFGGSEIDVEGDEVYCSGNPNKIANVTSGITQETTITSDRLGTGIDVFENIACIVENNYGLKIYNVTNTTTPSLLASSMNYYHPRSVDIIGNYAIIAEENMISIANITDPTNPVKIRHIDINSMVTAVEIQGEIAYVGYSNYSVVAYKITHGWTDDVDGDCISFLDEVYTFNTNPESSDTDGDLMSDGDEVLYSLNPNKDDAFLDLDGDGINNYNELLINTNPNNRDTDGDGYDDDVEIASGTSPTDITSFPSGDGGGFSLDYMSLAIGLISGFFLAVISFLIGRGRPTSRKSKGNARNKSKRQ
ncbi:MAG: hypothetical protein ACTSU9_15025 [Promethearchaeota archaeon]